MIEDEGQNLADYVIPNARTMARKALAEPFWLLGWLVAIAFVMGPILSYMPTAAYNVTHPRVVWLTATPGVVSDTPPPIDHSVGGFHPVMPGALPYVKPSACIPLGQPFVYAPGRTGPYCTDTVTP